LPMPANIGMKLNNPVNSARFRSRQFLLLVRGTLEIGRSSLCTPPNVRSKRL
jgi:hypothetical protein